MAKYRRFTKEDWYGYAGAEKFCDGSQPFIGELKFKNGDAYVLADNSGLSIEFYAAKATDEEKESDIADALVFSKSFGDLYGCFSKTSPVIAEAELRAVLNILQEKDNLLDAIIMLIYPEQEILKGFERLT